MRIGDGWPNLFNTTVLDDSQQPVHVGELVALGNIQSLILVVFEKCTQLWSAGQVRCICLQTITSVAVHMAQRTH
jgi:hypothetical protein